MSMSEARELLRRISSHSGSVIPTQFIYEIQELLAQPDKSEADKLKDAIELQVTVALSESISRLTTSITARGR